MTWSNRQQRGFSLLETLFALLLFSTIFVGLLNYQRALGQGFMQQWQQREAWRQAYQQLLGNEKVGWPGNLQRSAGPVGCQLLRASVTSPAARFAELTLLQCPETDR